MSAPLAALLAFTLSAMFAGATWLLNEALERRNGWLVIPAALLGLLAGGVLSWGLS